MTESLEKQTPPENDGKMGPSSPLPSSPLRGVGRFLLGCLLFLLALLGGFALRALAPASLPAVFPADLRVLSLEERLQKVEARLDVLARPAVVEEKSAASSQGPDSEDLEKLKANLTGLSGALAALQTQMEKSSQETNGVREKAQSGLATGLAFVQMERAALAGRRFEKERQTMRQLAGEDQALIDQLVRLESFALEGESDVPALRKEWNALSGQAQAALRKAGAQTWQDRVLVALEGLVSIRSLNPKPGETLSFAAIDLDLAQGDLPAALEKVRGLPQAVQDSVLDWHMKARKRMDMEAALDQIAAHLIGASPEAASVGSPDEPAPSSRETTP